MAKCGSAGDKRPGGAPITLGRPRTPQQGPRWLDLGLGWPKHLRGEKHALAAPGAPLLPKRALVLAQELLTRGVEAIKADS